MSIFFDKAPRRRAEVENLEQRQMLTVSISAATMVGPMLNTGATFGFDFGGTSGTQTVVGPATFNGVATVDTNLSTFGKDLFQTLDTTNGFLQYGTQSGGSITTYSPPEVILPALMLAGHEYDFSWDTSTTGGSGLHVDAKMKLVSSLPQFPIVTPAGTFACFEVDKTLTSTNLGGISSTSDEQEFYASNAGLVETKTLISGVATVTTELTSLNTGATHAADHLAFITQPASAVAGAFIAPAVTVEVEDSSDNIVAADNSQVTIAIQPSPNGAVPSGTLTEPFIGGIATFSDLSINSVGDNFELVATDGSLTSAISTPFNITQSSGPPSIAPTFGAVNIPSAVVAGGRIKAKLPVVLTDSGSSVKGPVTINIYADAGTNLDGNQVLITTLSKNLALKTGKPKTINVNLKSLPSTLPDGSYHLLAEVVDSANNSNVTASTQTVQVAAAFIEPVVSVGAVNPSAIAPGKSGLVLVTITNNGNVVGAGADISLSPSSDDLTPIVGIILQSIHSGAKILPGKSKTFKMHFKNNGAMTTGSYFPFVSATLAGMAITAAGQTPFTVG